MENLKDGCVDQLVNEWTDSGLSLKMDGWKWVMGKIMDEWMDDPRSGKNLIII